jgi:MFS family permease
MNFLKKFKYFEFEELYLKEKLRPGLVSLYSNRIILQLAIGILGLFFPILLFKFFNYDIRKVILYYIISFILCALFLPLGAMIMTKIGLKKSIFAGTFFYLCYFISLYFVNNNYSTAIYLTVLFITLFRILYWIPYHTNFAQFTNKRSRGKELAFLISIASILTTILPVASGFVIQNFGFNILFFCSTLITITSFVPLLFLKTVNEKYCYTYLQTFKELFRKENRRMLYAYIGDGAETIVGYVIWPIFIFELLKGNFLSVGIVSSLVIFFSIIFRLFMGELSDKKPKRQLIKIGSVLYSFGWIAKFFVHSFFQIFIINTYHNFVLIIRKTPFTSLMYEQAADRGHYVDEYTVLREISLCIGRILMLILILFIFHFTSLNYAFILAALASLLINLL